MTINEVISYLNKNYNQDSNNYNIFFGPRPGVIRLDNTTAISLWECGAIVCIGDTIKFINEDDGHWFLSNTNSDGSNPGLHCASYLKSFFTAMKQLDDYLTENGIPHHFILNSSYELAKPVFSDKDFICGYALGIDKDKEYIKNWKAAKKKYIENNK